MMRLARRPVLSVFCNGRSLRYSVHPSDGAWDVFQVLKTPAMIGFQFNITGPAPLIFNDAVRLTTQALGRRVQRFHIPAWLIVTSLPVLERLAIALPIKAKQLLRLNEDKAFSRTTMLIRLLNNQPHLCKGFAMGSPYCALAEMA